MPRQLDPEKISEIRDLVSHGHDPASVSEKTKVGINTVRKYTADLRAKYHRGGALSKFIRIKPESEKPKEHAVLICDQTIVMAGISSGIRYTTQKLGETVVIESDKLYGDLPIDDIEKVCRELMEVLNEALRMKKN